MLLLRDSWSINKCSNFAILKAEMWQLFKNILKSCKIETTYKLNRSLLHIAIFDDVKSPLKNNNKQLFSSSYTQSSCLLLFFKEASSRWKSKPCAECLQPAVGKEAELSYVTNRIASALSVPKLWGIWKESTVYTDAHNIIYLPYSINM